MAIKVTVNTGATIERSLVKRYIRRQIKKMTASTPMNIGACNAYKALIEWLDTQPKRTAAKVGGLGRSKKK